ncbi:HAD hydrolase family protein, partial [Candidatus Woesearchaeota archaeon]|nr:HAD hydrolase family protein [Candidatus Woesearchaeota archaeon]
EQATLAKKREFDEAFKLINPEEETTIIEKIKREGYNHTKGGRYHHIIGDNDKGRAVKILIGLYKKKDEKTVSVAVGDSSNDFEMLDVVDLPILVQKKDGSYASPKEEYNKIDGVGPEGWNKAIIEVFT